MNWIEEVGLPTKKNENKSLMKTIYESMLRSIILGEIRAGEVISEAKLAERFKTSRSPVREACIHLYKEGLISGSFKKGFLVTEVTPGEIQELFQVRQILEPAAAELAARRDQTPAFFSECHGMIDRMADLLTGERSYESSLEIGKIEHDLHHCIAKASGNRKIAKFVSETMNQFRRLHYHYPNVRKSPWMDVTNNEHRDIVEAIRAQEATKARRLMEEHVSQGAQRVIKVLFDQSVFQRT
jgi:DNA-binding GntR family transcriptional regulator